MSINGVWSTDIGGAYGWEAIGTVFLEDGQVRGGGRYHYTFGKYSESEDGSIIFELQVKQFGNKRALFGHKKGQLSIVVTAQMNGADKILGEATMPTRAEYGIPVRFKKRRKLPK
jgi:hypothetical protein